MDIAAMKEAAERLNALPREQKVNLSVHLAVEYGDRLSSRAIDRLCDLELGYPVDHFLIASLMSAGVELHGMWA